MLSTEPVNRAKYGTLWRFQYIIDRWSFGLKSESRRMSVTSDKMGQLGDPVASYVFGDVWEHDVNAMMQIAEI